MLSYRHSFHAGNHADVLKHCIWLYCLKYMTSKNKPLRVIDTHAGAGLYRLEDDGKRRGEYHDGIARLVADSDMPEPLSDYLHLIKTLTSGAANRYPGSPLISRSQLRPGDSAWFYELHSTDYPLLQQALGPHKQIHLRHDDGFTGLKGLLPPPEKRALALIDPSYEVKRDYAQVVDAIKSACKKLPAVSIALWYPVVRREDIDHLERKLAASGIANIQLFEVSVKPDAPSYGMTGSGMIVVNPPWTLWQAMEPVLPYLARQLGEGNTGHYRQKQLTVKV